MGRTRGIHWIATTHGTWLHGDPRGSWRKGRLIGPDPFLEANIRRRMTADAVVLTPDEIALVAEAFGEVVRERGHTVYAATVRPTHAHLVFAPVNEPIDDLVAALKHRAARRVLNERRRAVGDAPPNLWTKRPFVVFIFDASHRRNAIEYVRGHNRRAGLPADPLPWITPIEKSLTSSPSGHRKRTRRRKP